MVQSKVRLNAGYFANAQLIAISGRHLPLSSPRAQKRRAGEHGPCLPVRKPRNRIFLLFWPLDGVPLRRGV